MKTLFGLPVIEVDHILLYRDARRAGHSRNLWVPLVGWRACFLAQPDSEECE